MIEEQQKQIISKVHFQRKISKVGDSLYVRIGTKELEMIGNPGIVDVVVRDASLDDMEVECPKCHKKIVVNKNEEVIDCPLCGSENIFSEVLKL